MKSATSDAEHRLPRLLVLLTLCAALLVPELTAAKLGKVKGGNVEGDGAADTKDVKTATLEDGGKAKADRANAGDLEARKLARLRERLDVPDDGEWALIADRIAKVEELRRTAGFGANGARAVAASSEKTKRNTRAGASANPEFDALRAAVGDQFPDAEIKARLARAHAAYQQREAQLNLAQAELRAILSVRQEAVVVMAGVLPP